MVQIGEEYRVLPAFVANIDDGKQSRKQVGKVVYVHPKGRYALLSFEGVSGKPRECFYSEQLTEKNRVQRKKGKQS